jgi:gamma-glutamyltranspeptidase/glutathione hydrolase
VKIPVAILVPWFAAIALGADPAVTVTPVTAKHGMVVAGHPQAAAIGSAVLQAGGNAIDAAVATSLALGVAEPYGSGLGGKLMLLVFAAKTGRTHVVDAMDAAGSIEVASYLQRPSEERTQGYGAVCVPGLAAGLWAAHRQWGSAKWADLVQPAIALARDGFLVLPKTRDFFAEVETRLRRGDAEIARLYLPGSALPEVGTFLPNEDLARTMEALAQRGRDGFYRGLVAAAIVAAAERGGGGLTLADFAGYEARITEPIVMDFRGYQLVCAPPPASGAALFLPLLKALEPESFGGGPLRTAENLDRVGRVWRVVAGEMWRIIGDVPESRFLLEKLIAPDSIRAIREKAFAIEPPRKVAGGGARVVPFRGPAEHAEFFESAQAATTHFVVADALGNVVCATQSQSLHFGAGVVAPGTGVVLNNSMSNFDTTDAKALNYVAPGKRPRSTISPTVVLRDGRPVVAVGVPGSARIPTALLQVLLDRLVFNRTLAEAIGDARVHYVLPFRTAEVEQFEAERSLSAAAAESLRTRGWKVELKEDAGRGRHFGGVNAIEFNRDGTMTGYADPRRTNAAVGN